MSNLLKTFGRDGDSYGRHALTNPGGDNRQGDVIGKLGASALEYVDPMRFDPDYVGRHRHGAGMHPVEFLTDDRAPYAWSVYR